MISVDFRHGKLDSVSPTVTADGSKKGGWSLNARGGLLEVPDPGAFTSDVVAELMAFARAPATGRADPGRVRAWLKVNGHVEGLVGLWTRAADGGPPMEPDELAERIAGVEHDQLVDWMAHESGRPYAEAVKRIWISWALVVGQGMSADDAWAAVHDEGLDLDAVLAEMNGQAPNPSPPSEPEDDAVAFLPGSSARARGIGIGKVSPTIPAGGGGNSIPAVGIPVRPKRK